MEILKAAGAENLEGMMGTAPGSVVGEAYVTFADDYKAEFGKISPNPYITNAYDAMAVVGLAAYAAKAKGLPLTAKNIRNYLRVVANPPGEFIQPGEFKKAFDLLNLGNKQDLIILLYPAIHLSIRYKQNFEVLDGRSLALFCLY